jgi:hypothetical protein
MTNRSTRYSLLAAATGALISMAPMANATVYMLSLSGDPTTGSYGAFDSGGAHYQTFSLDLGLGGALPFTVGQDDEIVTTIALTSPLTVPGVNDYQFLGVNFNGPTPPVGVSTTGSFTFTGLTGSAPNPTSNNCGNCASDLFGQSGTGASFSFTGLTSDVTFPTLTSPYTIDDVSISYQVDSVAAPEPAAWALMLIGFGGLGALARRRAAVARLG